MAEIKKSDKDMLYLSYENEYEKMAFSDEALKNPTISEGVTALANEFKELFGMRIVTNNGIKRILDSIMVDGKNYNILRPGDWQDSEEANEAAMACAMARIKKLAVYERNPKSNDGVHHIVYFNSSSNEYLSVGNGIEDITLPPEPVKPRWKLFVSNQNEVKEYNQQKMQYDALARSKQRIDLIKENDKKYIKIAADQAASVADTEERTRGYSVNPVTLHSLIHESNGQKGTLMQRLDKAKSFTRVNSKEYNDFLTALGKVNKMWNMDYNAENRNQMLKAYENLEKACTVYLETHSTKRHSTMGEERVQIVRDVLNIQRREKKTLAEFHNYLGKNGEYILGDHVEKARYVELNENDYDIKVIGANTSKRFHIQGNGTNGIFTPEKADKTPGYEGIVMRNLNSAKNLPHAIAEQIYNRSMGATAAFGITSIFKKEHAFKYLINNNIMQDTEEDKALWDAFAGEMERGIQEASTRGGGFVTTKDFRDVFFNAVETYAPNEHKNTLKGHMDIIEFYDTISNTYIPMERKLNYLKSIGVCTDKDLKKGSETRQAVEQLLRGITIDTSSYINSKNARISYERRPDLNSRNIATSILAELIGCPDVVAKTEKATVVATDGRKREGILMEYVDGKGGYELKLDRKTKEAMAQRPNGDIKKKIADLQILDSLCAQTDRHMDNIRFQTDSNGVITDFKGIDNDMSFGITGVNTLGFHSINLPMITHIDETTANNIKNLDKEVLEYRLKDLLVQEEIDSLWERVSVIKEWIKDSSVNIVPTNEWKDKSWHELAKGNYVAKDRNFDYKNSNLFFKMGYYMVPYSQLDAKTNETEEDYNALKAATNNARQHEQDMLKDIREGNTPANRQAGQNAPTNQQANQNASENQQTGQNTTTNQQELGRNSGGRGM